MFQCSKRKGSFWPCSSELPHMVKGTIPIAAAVSQKFSRYLKKTTKMKCMEVGKQENVHFCSDRLGLGSKLLSDRSAFEVTFLLCRNSTTACWKLDLERILMEQVERNSIKLRSEFNSALAAGGFSYCFVHFSEPLLLEQLLWAFLSSASSRPLCFGFMTVPCCEKGMLMFRGITWGSHISFIFMAHL